MAAKPREPLLHLRHVAIAGIGGKRDHDKGGRGVPYGIFGNRRSEVRGQTAEPEHCHVVGPCDLDPYVDPIGP